MANLLIRGLSDAALARLDAEAAALGLSRNEYLRRRLDNEHATLESVTLSIDDLRRAAHAAEDLLDDAVMGDAWR